MPLTPAVSNNSGVVSIVALVDTVGLPPLYLTKPLAVVPDQFIANDLSVESEPPPVKPAPALIDT